MPRWLFAWLPERQIARYVDEQRDSERCSGTAGLTTLSIIRSRWRHQDCGDKPALVSPTLLTFLRKGDGSATPRMPMEMKREHCFDLQEGNSSHVLPTCRLATWCICCTQAAHCLHPVLTTRSWPARIAGGAAAWQVIEESESRTFVHIDKGATALTKGRRGRAGAAGCLQQMAAGLTDTAPCSSGTV
jgi:hypothetical protein